MAQKTGQKIEVVRGTTNAINIAVKNADGTPYMLETGEVVVFGVKENYEDDECLILKTTNSLVNGVAQISIAPDDTAELNVGRYVYDVGLQSGANYYSVIKASDFYITANVTKWGDG
jgi:hypothetical protein